MGKNKALAHHSVTSTHREEWLLGVCNLHDENPAHRVTACDLHDEETLLAKNGGDLRTPAKNHLTGSSLLSYFVRWNIAEEVQGVVC